MKLRTEHVFPPIPVRIFDWCAYDEDTYDGAPDAGPQVVGFGPTEKEAVEDFMEQWNEKQGIAMDRVNADEMEF